MPISSRQGFADLKASGLTEMDIEFRAPVCSANPSGVSTVTIRFEFLLNSIRVAGGGVGGDECLIIACVVSYSCSSSSA